MRASARQLELGAGEGMMNADGAGLEQASGAQKKSRSYMVYLIVLMGLVALMDQYLSTVKTTATPYIIEEYGTTAPHFSWLEALYLISSFIIFLLNGLNDVIGRKWAALILILMMGLSALGIVIWTPSLHLFMAFYAVVMYTTVSNMWSISVSEESPAEQRARNVSIVYVIGLIPLQALLPPLLIDRLGLDWKWMYGVMFLFMVPVLVLWLFMKETGRYRTIQVERRAGTRKRHMLGLGVIDRRDVRYIAISSAIWLCWLIYSVLYYWAGYYFMTLKGYSLTQWSMVLLATLIMAMTGGLAGGWLMDRIGRTLVLILGCVGVTVFVILMAFAGGFWLPVVTAISGFFTSLAYTWVVVYVPEIFPTERRGTCMGWTTTVARVSYVVAPALAAVLLETFPMMRGFWVVTGLIMLLPIGIISLWNPYETRFQVLEEIEEQR
jgi:MFS family permease